MAPLVDGAILKSTMRSEMARTTRTGANRSHGAPKRAAFVAVQERRIATPSRDLLLIKVGERHPKKLVSPRERKSAVLAKLARVIAKPGADRTRVFQSTSRTPVYAYFIDSEDTTQVIREDASGRQTVGRFVG